MSIKLQVASACNASWESMDGDHRVRYCTHCNLHVYNFNDLTEKEIKRIIRERQGSRLCGRLYRRADGTVITKDCQTGVTRLFSNMSRLAIPALSAAMSACFAPAQTATPQSLVQMAPAQSGMEVQVLDESGAVIPNARISLSGPNLKAPILGTADEAGRWDADGIPDGNYQLTIDARGFAKTQEDVKVVGHRTLSVQIKVQPGPVMGVCVEPVVELKLEKPSEAIPQIELISLIPQPTAPHPKRK